MNPQDVVKSTGLGGGKLATFLAPLVAGLVSAIKECGVENQLEDFAKKKAVQVVQQHEAVLAEQGERCVHTNDLNTGGAHLCLFVGQLAVLARQRHSICGVATLCRGFSSVTMFLSSHVLGGNVPEPRPSAPKHICKESNGM